jgi:TIGR03009 family protein
MRSLLVPPALLLANALAMAQPGAPPRAPNAGVGQLDTVLGGWDKSLASVRSVHAACQRTTLDKVFQSKEVFTGSVTYLKTPGQGIRASLELRKQTAQGPSSTIFEKYIYTGSQLYEYAPATKVIRIHDLPPSGPGQIGDDNFLSLVFGMKAQEAMKRYDLTLTTGAADLVTVTPSDKYYYYVRVQAKYAHDKADFTTARLVLWRNTFLPKQVWFLQPNGNQMTW